MNIFIESLQSLYKTISSWYTYYRLVRPMSLIIEKCELASDYDSWRVAA